ncbi:MAG: glycosyltransferase [Patescibacteria group bacterium]|nr:glycosyltransferase [Patescibacteria group bacterium]
MKILLINKFFYRRGGAETYFFDLAELLKRQGHEVAFFSMKGRENDKSVWSKYFVSEVDYTRREGILREAGKAAGYLYNFEARSNLKKLLADFKPDIVHLHNIYHQLSTSVLDALRDSPAPKILTLHDYKLICPNYKLFTRGRICERCFKHKYYNAIIYRCAQNSLASSALAAAEMAIAKTRQIYENVVDCYVSPSRFFTKKIKDWGVRVKRIEVVPNFVFLDEYEPHEAVGDYYLYAGRLAHEKGVSDLVSVFCKHKNIKLKIAGSGPLENGLKDFVKTSGAKNIEFFGHLAPDALKAEIGGCRAVIVPTLMHDNYPYGVLEAQALGKAIIASRLGGIPEMVEHGMSGYLYEPRNPDDLAARILDAEKNPKKLIEFGKQGRARVEKENGAADHYKKIFEIYESSLKLKNENSP